MTAPQRRLGFFGGTFDPIHNGHLILASYAAQAADLDIVLFAPAADPPHKDRAVTPVAHRIEMLIRAIDRDARFELTTVDLDRDGPHYSVDTLKILASQLPESELFFLMGSDSFRDLPTWYEPQRIVEYARLIVGQRPHSSFDWSALQEALPNVVQNSEFVEIPLIDISSTAIRNRVARGQPIAYLVPWEVKEYIDSCGLYLGRGTPSIS